MNPRTKRQREVLSYITNFIEERGYKPSYQQIARHFRIKSKSAIAKHITALENQGLLSRHYENGTFGLEIRRSETVADYVCEIQWLKFPFQDVRTEDFENLPLYLPKILLGGSPPENFLAFRVRNDEMLDKHIRAGDVVLIESRQHVRDGDLVVVLHEKRFIELRQIFRDGANFELRAAHPKYPPILCSAEDIDVKGIVRSLLRVAV